MISFTLWDMVRHLLAGAGWTILLSGIAFVLGGAMGLSPDAEPQWTLEPPGFGLHMINALGQIVSHQGTSAPYAGPFPFASEPPAILLQATA